MSALSGFWSLGVPLPPGEACRRMVEAQKSYGPHSQQVRERAEVAFGATLFHLLPEDHLDRQPLVSADGRFLLVADLRIDNRSELARAIGRDGPDLDRRSDSELLLAAFERWGEDVVDRLIGDFAFAVWDAQEKRLTLARDPFGMAPLHYHRGGGFFAFASMPAGLHALGMFPNDIDAERVAEFVADRPRTGPRTFFTSIEKIEPGHVTSVTKDGVQSRRYWTPRRRSLGLTKAEDLVAALREQLDRAVASRLRGCSDPVASHLSSGYDSSGVTATAARLLAERGGRVVAYTSAPRSGFAGPVPAGKLGDESGLAAATAAMHSNLDHVVVRSTPGSPFADLADKHRLLQCPSGHLCNDMWWSAINRAASEAGARVILNGQLGNYAFSAGGAGLLPDMLREGRLVLWVGEVARLGLSGALPLRSLLDLAAGPWLPRRVYAARRALAPSAGRMARERISFLSRHWSERLGTDNGQPRDLRPPRNTFALRAELLAKQDFGNFRKAALARWSLDERDPTADRRLIDFCFSLPLNSLLSKGSPRPLARRALEDRVAGAVLASRARGYQTADWFERIRPADVARELERVRNDPTVRDLLDLDRLDHAVDHWPSGGWETGTVIVRYRTALLRAVSAANFVRAAQGKKA